MHPPASVIELLQAMVRIDSVNSDMAHRVASEARLVDALETWAQGWGLQTQRIPIARQADQLLVTCGVDTDAPWWLFDAHTDTVGVEGMVIDPFSGEVREGKVYGRGACDTKGTGAAMLWALRDYALKPGPNNIALLFATDEECEMRGVRGVLEQDALGFQPDAVIVGEPTLHQAVSAHAGVMRIEVRTRGISVHSSMPAHGQSAITPMLKLMRAFEEQYIPSVTASHPRTGGAACSLNMLHGGASPNVIPDTCVATIDRRVAPGESAQDAIASMRAVLDRVEEPYELKACVCHPPLGDDANEALSELTVDVVRSLGLPCQAMGVPFATHAAYYAGAGLPAVVLGPGDPMQAHKKDEWVAVDEVERGVTVYGALMRRDPRGV